MAGKYLVEWTRDSFTLIYSSYFKAFTRFTRYSPVILMIFNPWYSTSQNQSSTAPQLSRDTNGTELSVLWSTTKLRMKSRMMTWDPGGGSLWASMAKNDFGGQDMSRCSLEMGSSINPIPRKNMKRKPMAYGPNSVEMPYKNQPYSFYRGCLKK